MFTGKVNDGFFTDNILPYTGKAKPEVIIGPSMGVDSAILKLGDKYMAVAEDPIFPSATMSPEDFAYVTVHIGASDVAVMGIKPQYMTYSLLLPLDTEEEYIARLVKAINIYAGELDISIVGGHTGYYGAVTMPTIGGITVWGVKDSFISPRGAKPGDDVIMTKGAAIEAAALLAYELDSILTEKVPEKLVKRAKDRFKEISVVKDAEVVNSIGGVHAMHDATEGGLFRGIWEIAQASGTGMSIDKDKILLPEDIKEVCAFFGLNPFEIISEGTLVLTCEKGKSQEIVSALKDSGIEAAIIGKVTGKSEGCVLNDNGKVKSLLPPEEDKFWGVFFSSLELKNKHAACI
ncbi:AIR synthase family protein [Clostridium oryzae]|uniref:Hydrogenase expression/formation protein HypE n=1 Tax=Clostridium oryzae TaxID=1450648 RepID=A0A1V4IXY9_9CLOT|nr:AIR synthase family protein [Clostridium oryzae]OPJ64634.1 hydrogenase expression/formation protein HypE [Clostridium oryzae]